MPSLCVAKGCCAPHARSNPSATVHPHLFIVIPPRPSLLAGKGVWINAPVSATVDVDHSGNVNTSTWVYGWAQLMKNGNQWTGGQGGCAWCRCRDLVRCWVPIHAPALINPTCCPMAIQHVQACPPTPPSTWSTPTRCGTSGSGSTSGAWLVGQVLADTTSVHVTSTSCPSGSVARLHAA